jgi:hypothetical protein
VVEIKKVFSSGIICNTMPYVLRIKQLLILYNLRAAFLWNHPVRFSLIVPHRLEPRFIAPNSPRQLSTVEGRQTDAVLVGRKAASMRPCGRRVAGTGSNLRGISGTGARPESNTRVGRAAVHRIAQRTDGATAASTHRFGSGGSSSSQS